MTTNNDYRINWKKLSITQEGEGTIVHPLVALLLTPIMGLMFLMFLPFIGFYLSAAALFQKGVSLFEKASTPEVSIGVAYLTGNETSEKTEQNTDLDELDKEIQARRSK